MGKKESPRHVAVTRPKREIISEVALTLHPVIWGGATVWMATEGRYGLAAITAGVTAVETGVKVSLGRSLR